jgi:hypothetical protein
MKEKRRRRRSTRRGGVPVRPPWGGGVEERGSSSERCGLKRCSGAALIGGEGRRGDAVKAVERHTGGPPLMAWWLGAQPFRGGEEGEGLGGAS